MNLTNGEAHDSLGAVPYISTHDAIAALIWRSIICARHQAGIISGHMPSQFSQAIDCRARMDLPKPYYGNAFYGIKSSLDFAHLTPPSDHPGTSRISGLQAAARVIRSELKAVTAEKYGDLLGFVERTELEYLTRFTVIEDLPFSSISLISYFDFEMHELDLARRWAGTLRPFEFLRKG